MFLVFFVVLQLVALTQCTSEDDRFKVGLRKGFMISKNIYFGKTLLINLRN